MARNFKEPAKFANKSNDELLDEYQRALNSPGVRGKKDRENLAVILTGRGVDFSQVRKTENVATTSTQKLRQQVQDFEQRDPSKVSTEETQRAYSQLDELGRREAQPKFATTSTQELQSRIDAFNRKNPSQQTDQEYEQNLGYLAELEKREYMARQEAELNAEIAHRQERRDKVLAAREHRAVHGTGLGKMEQLAGEKRAEHQARQARREAVTKSRENMALFGTPLGQMDNIAQQKRAEIEAQRQQEEAYNNSFRGKAGAFFGKAKQGASSLFGKMRKHAKKIAIGVALAVGLSAGVAHFSNQQQDQTQPYVNAGTVYEQQADQGGGGYTYGDQDQGYGNDYEPDPQDDYVPDEYQPTPKDYEYANGTLEQIEDTQTNGYQPGKQPAGFTVPNGAVHIGGTPVEDGSRVEIYYMNGHVFSNRWGERFNGTTPQQFREAGAYGRTADFVDQLVTQHHRQLDGGRSQ